MRGTPLSRYTPLPRHTIAVRKRAAVPALATNSSSGSASVPPFGSLPPQPLTVSMRLAATSGSAATSTSTPSRCMQSVIASVSSLHSAPLSVTIPVAWAASTRARLVMLFEPGMTISALVALNWASCSAENGTTSMSFGSGMLGPRPSGRRQPATRRSKVFNTTRAHRGRRYRMDLPWPAQPAPYRRQLPDAHFDAHVL